MENNNSNQFGMTQEDIKAANRQEILFRVKAVFALIWPTVVKILSSIIYYLLRFIKAFVSASIRMIMGKEV